MLTRAVKWSKRLLVPIAALPVFQAAGTCDYTSFLASGTQQFVGSTFNLVVSSAVQVLLQTFPSADLLQILLGGNRQPFFTG